MQSKDRRLQVNVASGLVLQQRGPTYTLMRLLQGMQGDGLDVRAFVPLDRWRQDFGFPVTSAGSRVAGIDQRVPFRYARRPLEWRMTAAILAASAREDALTFTWGEVPLRLSRELHRRGRSVVREKFNCTKVCARDVLTRAYRSLGATFEGGISDAGIAKEAEELSLADAVFSPSPMVRRSLLDLGIAEERIIPTSYGWEPARFADARPVLPAIEGQTLLFAGYICVRKGAHLVLEAWRQAAIQGRLVLVGDIEPLIAERYADVLARDDVLHVAFTPRIGDYYASADWFIFPSLEEGGPQVTYEAGGCGVPVLVSAMGAGAFARDGIEGVVLDVDGDLVKPWADLIASLPDRKADRRRMSVAARSRAMEFTYDRVGELRRAALLTRFA